MSQTYGIETPSGHTVQTLRQPVRYVVVIDAGDSPIARLLVDTRQQVGELDAGAPEVIQMIQGLSPAHAASGPEWDVALQAHSAQERDAAKVYTLTV
ncbi:MAG: hypothetical protein KGL57_08030 [Burkholderiales bacterium]|nr:hypothetical protein [Burkholderiales bacterium]